MDFDQDLQTNTTDILVGDNSSENLEGEKNNDSISAGGGADSVDGGKGDDTIDGGKGDDTLTGGKGEDNFVASDNDVITDYNPEEDGTIYVPDSEYKINAKGDDAIIKGSDFKVTLKNALSGATEEEKEKLIGKIKNKVEEIKETTLLTTEPKAIARYFDYNSPWPAAVMLKSGMMGDPDLENYGFNHFRIKERNTLGEHDSGIDYKVHVKFPANDITDSDSESTYNEIKVGNREERNYLIEAAGNADKILGNNQSSNIIFAYGGNDTVQGGDGNDYIDGGEGSDVFVLTDGNDVIEKFDGGDGDTLNLDKSNVTINSITNYDEDTKDIFKMFDGNHDWNESSVMLELRDEDQMPKGFTAIVNAKKTSGLPDFELPTDKIYTTNVRAVARYFDYNSPWPAAVMLKGGMMGDPSERNVGFDHFRIKERNTLGEHDSGIDYKVHVKFPANDITDSDSESTYNEIKVGNREERNYLIEAAGNADKILGNNQSSNIIFAYGGNDTVQGGDGNDYIDGGEGSDVFVLTDGNDVIEKFDGGDGDTLNLDKSNVTINSITNYDEDTKDIFKMFDGNHDWNESSVMLELRDEDQMPKGFTAIVNAKKTSGLPDFQPPEGPDENPGGGGDNSGGGGGDNSGGGGGGGGENSGDGGLDGAPGNENNSGNSGGNGSIDGKPINPPADGNNPNDPENALRSIDVKPSPKKSAFEEIQRGSQKPDKVVGDSSVDKLTGKDKADILKGKGGDDYLFGDRHADTLNGGKGADVLQGGNGKDDLRGKAGRDVLYGGKGADVLTGDNGNDVFVLSAGKDVITDFKVGRDDIGRVYELDLILRQKGDDLLLKGNDGVKTLLLNVEKDDFLADFPDNLKLVPAVDVNLI